MRAKTRGAFILGRASFSVTTISHLAISILWSYYYTYVGSITRQVVAPGGGAGKCECIGNALKLVAAFGSIAAHFCGGWLSLCAGTRRARYSGVAVPIDGAVSATLRITNDSEATYILKNVGAWSTPSRGVNAFTGRPRFNACRPREERIDATFRSLCLLPSRVTRSISTRSPSDTGNVEKKKENAGEKKIDSRFIECDKVCIPYVDN